MNKYTIGSICLSILFCSIAQAQTKVSESQCGSLNNPVGPWDYRTLEYDKKRLVEEHHLDGELATLAAGKIIGFFEQQHNYVGGGLDYTLRAIPNHPRALNALDEYARKTKSETPPGLPRTVECYFERAVRFRPDDAMAQMLYGVYLFRRSNSAAESFLRKADELDPENSNIAYNIGLYYLNRKDLDKALEYAHKAYRLGFPLPGLMNELKKKGKWTPVPPAQSAPQEASAPQQNTEKK